MTGLLWNNIITATSKGRLGGREELPGAVETEGLGIIKKPPCRKGQDKAQMAEEILTGELPPTPQRPPTNQSKELKDRFEAGENPCDRCRWWNVKATDFPCYRCTHNNAIDRTGAKRVAAPLKTRVSE